jgi:hypothetical protein
MKIAVKEIEKAGELISSRQFIEKLKSIVIMSALSSILKYKLLGIKGNMYRSLTKRRIRGGARSSQGRERDEAGKDS